MLVQLLKQFECGHLALTISSMWAGKRPCDCPLYGTLVVVWRSRARVVKAATPLRSVPLQQLEQKIVSSCSADYTSLHRLCLYKQCTFSLVFFYTQFTLFLVTPLCVKQWFSLSGPGAPPLCHMPWEVDCWVPWNKTYKLNDWNSTCLFIIHSLVTYFTSHFYVIA